MGLLNWIFDIYQHTQIDRARQEAAETRRQLAAVHDSRGGVDTERLERALGELALATKTLQRVMVDKGVCSGAEFTAMLDRVDREDGRPDGQSPV